MQTIGKVAKFKNVPPPSNLPSLKSGASASATSSAPGSNESSNLSSTGSNLGWASRPSDASAPSRPGDTRTPPMNQSGPSAGLPWAGPAGEKMPEAKPQSKQYPSASVLKAQEFPELDAAGTEPKPTPASEAIAAYGPGPPLRPPSSVNWSQGTIIPPGAGGQLQNSGSAGNGHNQGMFPLDSQLQHILQNIPPPPGVSHNLLQQSISNDLLMKKQTQRSGYPAGGGFQAGFPLHEQHRYGMHTIVLFNLSETAIYMMTDLRQNSMLTQHLITHFV